MASIPSNAAIESGPGATTESVRPRWVFPRWFNFLLPLAIIAVVGGAAYMPTLVYLGFSPMATDVGYAPEQPIKYSHAVHVGQLGIDCRYCHTTVEHAAFAAVPPAQTCIGCHAQIKKDSLNLTPLWDTWTGGRKEGMPIEWVKIHDLPDYSYFNHAAHVNKGVGCIECHGRVDQMEVVYQAKPLNMAWCLECHRQPEKYLRPPDQVTNMQWTPESFERLAQEQPSSTTAKLYEEYRRIHADGEVTQERLGAFLKAHYQIKNSEFMTACSTCHR